VEPAAAVFVPVPPPPEKGRAPRECVGEERQDPLPIAEEGCRDAPPEVGKKGHHRDPHSSICVAALDLREDGEDEAIPQPSTCHRAAPPMDLAVEAKPPPNRALLLGSIATPCHRERRRSERATARGVPWSVRRRGGSAAVGERRAGRAERGREVTRDLS